MKAIFLSVILLAGCAVNQATVTANSAPTTPPTLKQMLPQAPGGFESAVDVSVRNRDTIFEQINGGSVSYLANGMSDALFATYLRTGHEGHEIMFEMFRFKNENGAKSQFQHISNGEGKPWIHGTTAVRHEYGVELIKSNLIIRVLFNDGPTPTMKQASESMATLVIAGS